MDLNENHFVVYDPLDVVEWDAATRTLSVASDAAPVLVRQRVRADTATTVAWRRRSEPAEQANATTADCMQLDAALHRVLARCAPPLAAAGEAHALAFAPLAPVHWLDALQHRGVLDRVALLGCGARRVRRDVSVRIVRGAASRDDDGDAHAPAPADVWGALLALEARALRLDGMHAQLQSRVRVLRRAPDSCAGGRVVLLELLPRAVFVDRYQLADLEAADAERARASVYERVDLEVPTYSAAARPLAVHVAQRAGNASADGASLAFDLPLHARYQQPHRADGYTNVAILPPLALLECDDGALMRVPLLPTGAPLRGEIPALVWRIPNGLLWHLPFVMYGTLAVTCLAALFMLRALWPRDNSSTGTKPNRRRPKQD